MRRRLTPLKSKKRSAEHQGLPIGAIPIETYIQVGPKPTVEGFTLNLEETGSLVRVSGNPHCAPIPKSYIEDILIVNPVCAQFIGG